MPFKKLLIASEEAKRIQIKGIEGIKRALIRKEKDEYVIYTESGREGVIKIPAWTRIDDHELGLRDLPRLRGRGGPRRAPCTRRTGRSPSRVCASTSVI